MGPFCGMNSDFFIILFPCFQKPNWFNKLSFHFRQKHCPPVGANATAETNELKALGIQNSLRNMPICYICITSFSDRSLGSSSCSTLWTSFSFEEQLVMPSPCISVRLSYENSLHALLSIPIQFSMPASHSKKSLAAWNSRVYYNMSMQQLSKISNGIDFC